MATIKQKKALFNLVENHGNVSKSMRQAGYKPKTAKNPKNLTDSVGFRELLLQYFPNERINEVLDDLISDKKDKRSRLDALREVIKLRDLYPDKKIKLGVFDERKEFFE